MAEVLHDVKHAFFGMCVHTGQPVLAAMMEADRQALCAPKGRPQSQRAAYRGSHTSSAVVLGGQRISVKRPRVRSVDVGELHLPSLEWASAIDPLDVRTLHAIGAGVSTRRYRRTVDDVPQDEQSSSTSKSAVLSRFVALSTEQMGEWLTRRTGELQLPVVMIDCIYIDQRVILVALGIDAKRRKHVLGLREGSTEKTQVVKALLSDLIERGLDGDQARLWVIDDGRALRRAITQTFGGCALHSRRQAIEGREMVQRWVASALIDADTRFRALRVYRDIQQLIKALQARVPKVDADQHMVA